MRFNLPAHLRDRRLRREEDEHAAEERLAQEMLSDPDVPINRRTLQELKHDSERYGARGQWLFAIAILLGAALLAVSYHLTGVYLDDLQRAEDDREMVLILLLVRGTFFGALSVGFLYGVFTVANAYVDQSTRFRKRLYSAHMLNYAFRTFGDTIEKDGKVTVRDLVVLFAAWNENVDSAFSRVRFQRKSPDVSLGSKYGGLFVRDRDREDETPADNGKRSDHTAGR
jgi:hypothetical protein